MTAWASIVRRRGLRSAKFPSVSRLRFTCRLRVACEQACIGAFAFYLIGYGFAYDKDDNTNGFIGAGKSTFALSGDDYDHETSMHGSAPTPRIPDPNPNQNRYPNQNPSPSPNANPSPSPGPDPIQRAGSASSSSSPLPPPRRPSSPVHPSPGHGAAPGHWHGHRHWPWP